MAGACVAVLACAGAAFAAAGDPDPGFGSGGIVYPAFCGSTGSMGSVAGPPRPWDVIGAPDGDFYVAGDCLDSGTDGVFVARFLPNGALDTSYGSDGEWVGQLGEVVGVDGAPSTGDVNGGDQLGLSMALTPSGELVVATHASDPDGDPQVAVAELTASGVLDPGFGTDGVLRQQLSADADPNPGLYDPFDGSGACAVAVQPDGRIIIAGFADTSDGAAQAFVERLTAAGAPDPTFGTDGIYEDQYGFTDYDEGGFSSVYAVLVQANGDIVLGAAADQNPEATEFVIDRLTSAGVQDPSFTTTDVQAALLGDSSGQSFPSVIAQTSNGEYLLGGRAQYGDYSPDVEMAVAEFTSSGPLDTSFGSGGIFNSAAAPTSVGSMAVQPDGKIVLVSGYAEGAGPSEDTQQDLQYVVRLTPTGGLDGSFGNGGIRSYELAAGVDANGNPQTIATSAATTPGQGLITVGTASGPNLTGFPYIQKLGLEAPPTVTIAQTPLDPIVGQPVQFSANAVPDTGNTISSIDWDLGSGTFTEASGDTAQKTFAAPGTYTVRAQATDDNGLSTTATQTVTVTAQASGITTPITPTPTTKSPITATTTTTPSTLPGAMSPQAKLTAVTVKGEVTTLKLSCATARCGLAVTLSTVEHLAGTRHIGHAATSRNAKLKSSTGRVTIFASTRVTLKPDTVEVLRIKLDAAGRQLLHHDKRARLLLTVKTIAKPVSVIATRQLTFR